MPYCSITRTTPIPNCIFTASRNSPPDGVCNLFTNRLKNLRVTPPASYPNLPTKPIFKGLVRLNAGFLYFRSTCSSMSVFWLMCTSIFSLNRVTAAVTNLCRSSRAVQSICKTAVDARDEFNNNSVSVHLYLFLHQSH